MAIAVHNRTAIRRFIHIFRIIQLPECICPLLKHSSPIRFQFRIGSKYVKMAAALSFAQPEILSLPEETLTAIVNDPAVADYKFNLEDLLRGKPHTLTKAEEKLLASFGEVMSAPSEIYHNLEDADLLFDAVKDGSGETVEVTGSNFVPLEMSTARIRKKEEK